MASILAAYYFSPDIPDITKIAAEPTLMKISKYEVVVGERVPTEVKTEIFRTTYYPFNSSITFRGLRSIIEAYMLENNLSVQKFYFEFGDSAYLSTIIYSRSRITGITAEDFLNKRFLTTQTAKISHSGLLETMSYYIPYPSSYLRVTETVDVPITQSTTYRRSNGTIGTCSVTTIAPLRYGLGKINSALTFVSEGFNPNPLLPPGCTLLFYRMNIGGRYMNFYITPNKEGNSFYFRNNFNSFELAVFPSSTTIKTETKSSTAICDDQMVQYDIEHTQSHEVQSAQLLLSYAKWLTEMMTSPDVRFNDPTIAAIESKPKVLITDYTSELSDAPGEECNVKFEWQYATGDMSHDLSQEVLGVFTEQFTAQFD